MALPGYLRYLDTPEFLKSQARLSPTDAAVVGSFVDPAAAEHYMRTAVKGARLKGERISRKSRLNLMRRKTAEELPLRLRSAQLTGEYGTARYSQGLKKEQATEDIGLRRLRGSYERGKKSAKSSHDISIAKIRAARDDDGSSTFKNILGGADVLTSAALGYADYRLAKDMRDYYRSLIS
jgi:hypothetical protein